MSIAKQAKLLSLLAILVAFFAALTLYWSVWYVRKETYKQVIVDDLTRDVIALDGLSYELLLGQHERSSAQWQRAYDRIANRLAGSNVQLEVGFQGQLFRELAEMEPIFQEFAGKVKNTEIAPVPMSNDNLFWVGQLRTRLATIVRIVEDWQDNSANKLQYTLAVGGVLAASAALLAVALVLGWAVLLRRSIISPLKHLKAAIGELEEGNWQARVSEEGTREFSEVATAFNKMAEKLSTAKVG